METPKERLQDVYEKEMKKHRRKKPSRDEPFALKEKKGQSQVRGQGYV